MSSEHTDDMELNGAFFFYRVISIDCYGARLFAFCAFGDTSNSFVIIVFSSWIDARTYNGDSQIY